MVKNTRRKRLDNRPSISGVGDSSPPISAIENALLCKKFGLLTCATHGRNREHLQS
jgi:hypothetical protein